MAEERELPIDTRRRLISPILDAFFRAFGNSRDAVQRLAWESDVADEQFGTTNRTYIYPPKQRRESYANDRWRITETDHWLYGVTYVISRETAKGDGRKIVRIVIGKEDAPSYQEAERLVEDGDGVQITDYLYKEAFQATGSDAAKLIANEHNNAAACPLILRIILDIPQP